MKKKIVKIDLNKDGSMPKKYRRKLCKIASEIFYDRLSISYIKRPIGFCEAIKKAILSLDNVSIKAPQGDTLHIMFPEFAPFKPDKAFGCWDYWYLEAEGRKREIIFDIVNHKLNS